MVQSLLLVLTQIKMLSIEIIYNSKMMMAKCLKLQLCLAFTNNTAEVCYYCERKILIR